MLDLVVLSLACIFSLRDAGDQLILRRPVQYLCEPQSLLMLIVTTAMVALVYGLTCWYMSSQAWYAGGTGTSTQVYPVQLATSGSLLYAYSIATHCWFMCLTEGQLSRGMVHVRKMGHWNEHAGFMQQFCNPSCALLEVFSVDYLQVTSYKCIR